MNREKLQKMLDISILLLLGISSVISVVKTYPIWLSIILVCLTFFMLLWFLKAAYKSKNYQMNAYSKLNSISLLGENNEIQKNWHIEGEQSLVIGKSYKNNSVDIDLSDTDYAVLVAKEHAVMNCIDGIWYLEDLGTRNGTGVKTKDSVKIHRLKDKPYKLEKNDCIYIAKTKLIVT